MWQLPRKVYSQGLSLFDLTQSLLSEESFNTRAFIKFKEKENRSTCLIALLPEAEIPVETNNSLATNLGNLGRETFVGALKGFTTSWGAP